MNRKVPKHSTLAIALSHAILEDQINYRMAKEDAEKCADCRGLGEHADEINGDTIVMCMTCGGSGEKPKPTIIPAKTNGAENEEIRRYAVMEPKDPPRPPGHKPYA